MEQTLTATEQPASKQMQPKTKAILAVVALFLVLLSAFLYEWLTSSIPLVYLNVIVWFGYFMGAAYFVIILVNIYTENRTYQLLIALVTVTFLLYTVWCIHCSFFYEKLLAQLEGDAGWFPVVRFSNIWKTMTDFTWLKKVSSLVVENESINLTFRFTKTADTGSSFLNVIRVIEVIPFFYLPIKAISKPKSN